VRRTKLLLQLFGFESHDAPGEAEAECALLQQRGLVDAVLSEDVDTLMFGSGLTIRDWSCEGTGKTPPSHVSLYDAKVTKDGKSGLDREGMILVALMSGGDYDTAGVARCGAKIACEAARAGYGKSLCDLSPDDSSGLLAWRENLAHELRTNEAGHFRQKNKAITVPDDFPKKEILQYYMHPVVSSEAALLNLRSRLQWDREIDSKRLRIFVDECFEWTSKLSAKRLIRLLAPPMLIYKLRERPKSVDSGHGNLVLIEAQEREIVQDITGERQHFSTDGIPELRLTFEPYGIVRLDLEAEIDDESNPDQQDEYLAVDEENLEVYQSDNETTGKSRSMSPMKNRLAAYDPTKPCKTWVSRSIARVGVPLKVEDYEESLMLKQSRANAPKRKAATKATATKHGMKQGALDRYFVTSKPVATGATLSSESPNKKTDHQPQLPPVYLAPSLDKPPLQPKGATKEPLRSRREYRKAPSGDRYCQVSPKPSNPWAATQPHSSQPVSANVSKPGISLSNKDGSSQASSSSASQMISSYDISSSRNLFPKKHSRNGSPPLYVSSISDAEILTGSVQLPSVKKRTPVTGDQGYSVGSSRTTQSDAPMSSLQINRKLDIDLDDQYQPTLSDEEYDALPPLDYLLSPLQTNPISTEDNKGTQDAIDLMSSSPLSHYTTTKQAESPPAKGGPSPHVDVLSFADSKVPKKRFLAPRESLPGAWKTYTEKELENMERKGRGRQKWRVSQVEALDLTQD
jgi:Holliday junction resolvase YEN1